MPRNLADGQLASSSATILGVGTAERVVSLSLFNTSSSATETVVITLLRVGSTARTIARFELEAYETAQINGQGMDPSDILAGYSTSANIVDYTVGNGAGPFSLTLRDATGAPKATQSIEVTIPANSDLLDAVFALQGLGENIRDALLQIQ